MLKRNLLGLAALVGTSSAFAAVPVAVTDAITAAGTDAAVVGGAVLVVLVGIKAFKYIRRAM
jgi:hypothetical protein